MTIIRRFAGPAALALSILLAPAVLPERAQAAEISVVVNGTPITSTDIQRRAAFIRLQQRRGNARELAIDELVEQTIRMQEAKRLRIVITDKQANDAYANFARGNGMQPKQMDQILAQSGVTRGHFLEFVRSQMAWGQVLSARQRGGGGNHVIDDAVRAMAKKGGAKPTATEYVLEQVIFVVPDRDRRALLGKRKAEAQKLRARYTGCETSRELVRGMIDVTVRPLGRILEQELPPLWEKAVKATKAGSATAPLETPRGVEFVGVCSTRVTNDDRVAELTIMQDREKSGSAAEDASKKYMDELKARARVVRR